MAESAEVLVIGGGVIGCSVAYFLAKAGVSVTVLERQNIASGASGVAAGILAVINEHNRKDDHLFKLGLASLKLFPHVTKALKEETGLDPEYVAAGALRVAFTEDEEQRLRALIPQLKGYLDIDWISGDDLLQTEPALNPAIRGALYTPGEHQVRAARLTQAYARGAANLGARFRLGTLVAGFTYQGRRITGVRLAEGGQISADHVVLAAGPWSGLLTDELGVAVPVRPVRGQILSLRGVSRVVHLSIFHELGYVTPKVDGSVVVGATQEEVGFDARLTASGVGSLLQLAPRLAPSLADAEVGEIWVGLRPGSPDDAPILGPVPGWAGVTVATGHFRSGIVLSPITGKLIAEHITQGATSIPLEPFSLARFG